MDISSNSIHDLHSMMYYYQRNMRDYTDNIHEYNNNMTMYMNILNNPHSRDYLSFRPVHQVFRDTSQRRDEGNAFRQRFEDVVVRPTEAQITRALETFAYSPMEEPHTCPITLEPIQEGEEVGRIRHCGHMFRRSAIEGWFLRNVRCPVCRYDIREYDVSGNDSSEFDDLIHEFAEEGRAFMNRTPLTNLFTNRPLANTLANAIRTFVNNELQRMPVNDATTELLYSFDLPLTLDASGNYRL